jgi:hypothetical protein
MRLEPRPIVAANESRGFPLGEPYVLGVGVVDNQPPPVDDMFEEFKAVHGDFTIIEEDKLLK